MKCRIGKELFSGCKGWIYDFFFYFFIFDFLSPFIFEDERFKKSVIPNLDPCQYYPLEFPSRSVVASHARSCLDVP